MKAKKTLPIWILCNGKRFATCFGVSHYIQDEKPKKLEISLVQNIGGEWVQVEDPKYLKSCHDWLIIEVGVK